MSTTYDRWRGKLVARRKLEDAARRRHVAHPTVATRAKLALRKAQVAYAERVVARHAPAPRVKGMSAQGVAFVADFEGFRANAYRDVVGVLTQGYGETKGVTPGKPWSREYAMGRLRSRLDRDYLAPVLHLADAVGLHLSQREADALGSLSYNLGPGIFGAGRTMGDAIRSKDRRRIADAFLVYDKAGGQRVDGLTRRRRAERARFLGLS